VPVCVAVAVRDGVQVRVGVGVMDGVSVRVAVGVIDGVHVRVGVRVMVGVRVWVGVAVRTSVSRVSITHLCGALMFGAIESEPRWVCQRNQWDISFGAKHDCG